MRTTLRHLLWPLLVLLAPQPLLAAESGCRSLTELTVDSLETFQFEADTSPRSVLTADGDYRLADVEVVRQNVFEREENWLHRLANRYHALTDEEVVLNTLPVAEGDPVDVRLLSEAERILRSKVYLYDARLIPKRLCGDELDVMVVTRDVWTLMPQLSLARTGSENEAGIGINDTNVFGSGKSVSLAYEKDKDRRGIAFAFGDPNVAGSRWALDLAVVDNDDGERAAATLQYPFYALHVRRAFSVSVDHDRRDEGLFFLGDEVWEFQADTRTFRAFTGWSSGVRGRFVNRLLVGYAHEEYAFRLPAELEAAFPALEAPERDYSYPFVAFQRLEDDYRTLVNLDRVQRTEDVALGAQLYAELGYSAAGGPHDHLVGRVRYSDGAWLNDRHLMSFSAWLDGFYDMDDNASENLTLGAVLSYRYQHAQNWSTLVRSSASAIRNQTLDQALLLGGEIGLRGYPNRYQIGDRRFLVTVEERYYSNVYPLRMFRLGGAVFLDVGRAWYDRDAPEWVPRDRGDDHFQVLANAGFGLRLESTRTRGDQIVHLDVAFPLRKGPNVRGVEVTLTAKASL